MPFSQEIAAMFKQSEIYHMTRNDVRWYCVKELCNAFGFSNTSHCRRKAGKGQCKQFEHFPQSGKGGEQFMLFIQEDAMYRLILTSRQATVPGTKAHTFLMYTSQQMVKQARPRFNLDKQLENLKV